MAPLQRPAFRPILLVVIIACFALIVLTRMGTSLLFQQVYAWLFSSLIIFAAVGLLLGVLNVLSVHLRRVQRGASEWAYSLVLVICLSATLAAGLVAPEGIDSPLIGWLFDTLIAPGQMALFALLPFFLAVAAWRYMRLDRPGGIWLLFGAVVTLLLQMPLATLFLARGVSDAIEGMIEGPVTSSLRGVLLGSGLAVAVAVLRILLGRS